MTNWFYTDNDGQKRVPINGTLLRILADNGRIRPETTMETESGQQSQAGQMAKKPFPPRYSFFNHIALRVILVLVIAAFVGGCSNSSVKQDYNALINNPKLAAAEAKEDYALAQDIDRQFLRERVGKNFSRWEKAAIDGVPEGAVLLAFCYRYGIGVDKNPPKAAEWLKRAAEGGLAEAQIGYAVAGEELRLISRSETKEWLRKAAAQGHKEAQKKLADIEELEKKYGVPAEAKPAKAPDPTPAEATPAKAPDPTPAEAPAAPSELRK